VSDHRVSAAELSDNRSDPATSMERRWQIKPWRFIAIGGGAGGIPSLGAEVARLHIPPTEFLILLLAGPALGVIGGAIAYAIARHADRSYMSMIQQGQLALVKEAQQTANVYMKVDAETLEFRTIGAGVPVNGSSGLQQPQRMKGVRLEDRELVQPVISLDDSPTRPGTAARRRGAEERTPSPGRGRRARRARSGQQR
jgi:hypothetical protein